MRYMLDTNICIYIIKKRSERLIGNIMSHELSEIAISSITLSELEYGVEKSMYPDKNRMALYEFMVPFDICSFDSKAALEYGRIRSALERKGKVIGPMDLLIGAHARSQDLILVTNNEKEFTRINGLKVENWTT